MLFFKNGYERTSVQEIIKSVGVAKGTFYHYFNSKVDLLDALTKRMYKQSLPPLEAIIADETLSAVEKFEQFFEENNQWKRTNKGFLLETVRVIYQDENILFREKMRKEALKLGIPLLAQIIEQGVEEEVFDVLYAHETAEFIFAMSRVVSETVVDLLLSDNRDMESINHVKHQISVYNLSVKRMLGMSHGSVNLIRVDDLDQWL